MKIEIVDVTLEEMNTVNVQFKDKKLKIVPTEFIMTGNMTKDTVTKFMSDYVVLNAVTAHIGQQISEMKLAADMREAVVDQLVRAAWEPDDGKMTEAGVKARVATDKELQNLDQLRMKLSTIEKVLQVLLQAGTQKYNVLAASQISHITTN